MLFRATLIIAFGLYSVGLVKGQCHVVSHRYVSKPAYVEKVIVKEVPVFTRFAAVALLADLPSYSAVYVPPPVVGVPPVGTPGVQPVPPAQAVPAPASELQQIMSFLKEMDGRLKRLETGMPLKQELPPAKMPKVEEGPPGVVGPLFNKCAACHELMKAPGEGGGFVMFDGTKRSNLTAEQKLKIARKIRSGAMPPADNKLKIPPVTDEEYAKIAEELGF